MTSWSPPPISVWQQRCFAVPAEAFAPGLAFVLSIATEFRRAAEATHRYERLKCMARAGDDPAASTARRIYIEFYSDG
jgi:hypothetical protein